MPETEVHAVVSFANKANGWLLVAVGGFLLALKETYELDQGLDKPLIWLWIVIILFPVLAVIYTASGVARGEKLLKQANDKKPTSTK